VCPKDASTWYAVDESWIAHAGRRIVTERGAPKDPFASFSVDRVTREDGRYLLYYAWTGPADVPDDTARPPDPAPSAQAWTPEAQPGTDV